MLTEPVQVLKCLQLDKKQGDLGVDLTEPEKAFDWIRNLWSRLTEPVQVLNMIENLTESFLKGKGQSYAMHDMDQAVMFST